MVAWGPTAQPYLSEANDTAFRPTLAALGAARPADGDEAAGADAAAAAAPAPATTSITTIRTAALARRAAPGLPPLDTDAAAETP